MEAGWEEKPLIQERPGQQEAGSRMANRWRESMGDGGGKGVSSLSSGVDTPEQPAQL